MLRNLLIAASFTALLVAGCTKKKENAHVATFDLIEALPGDTIGFLATDFLSPRYNESTKGRWAKLFNIIPIDQKSALAMMNLQMELTGPNKGQDQAVGNIGFLTKPENSDIPSGICSVYVAKTGGDLSWFKSRLLETLKANNIEHAEENDGTISVNLKDEVGYFGNKLFVKVLPSNIWFGGSKRCLQHQITKTNPPAEIVSSPTFQEFLKKERESFAFQVAAVDIKALSPVIDEFIKKNSPGTQSQPIQIKELLYSSNFDRGLRQNVKVVPLTDAQTNSVNLDSDPITGLIPDQAALSLDFTGSVFADPTLAATGMLPPSLAAIQRVALYIRSGGVGSIAPELSILIKSQNPKATLDELSATIQGLLGLAAGSMSPWNTGKIGNIEVHSSISPIGGLGVFMGNIEGATLISSSDEPFRYFQDPNLVENTLEKRLKEFSVMRSPTLLSGHIDFTRIAAIYSEVKGTLALLAPQPDDTQTKKWEEFLTAAGLVVFELKTDGPNYLVEVQIPE
jgi:hypothetical protein